MKGIKNLSYSFGLILLLLANCIYAVAFPKENTLYYTSQKQVVHVLGENEGYTSAISIRGFCLPATENSIQIYYGQLENIENIKAAYQGDNAKQVSIKKNDLLNHAVLTSSFYSDFRAISFNLPKQPLSYPFQYSYTCESKMLMYLSSFQLNDFIRTDTFSYVVHIPTGLSLLYRIYGDTTALKKFSITKTTEGDGEVWEIVSLPEHAVKKPKNGSALSSAQFIPVIQLLVLPSAHKNNPEAHFNDWYLNLIEPHSHLTDSAFHEITFGTKDLGNDAAIISKIFKTVQQKIHYIAIEDGIRAFQPKDVNAVWLEKQGDCKDMANLLCQTLKKLNYDARIAVSSSVGHSTDFVFPSLSSGDHCICVVKINGEWKYLDATDDQCEFGFPSRHTQGRNIFIVNEGGGELHRIEKAPAQKNVFSFYAAMNKNGNGMDGSVGISMEALSKYRYLSAFERLSQRDALEIIRKDLEALSRNLKYDSLKVDDRDSTLTLNGAISTAKNFTAVQGKEYLSLNFLPFPHAYPQEIDSFEKVIFDYALNASFDFIITLPEVVSILQAEPVQFDKNGFTFRFSCEQIDAKRLQIKYSCVMDWIEVEGQAASAYNEMNAIILKIFSKPIAYAIQ